MPDETSRLDILKAISTTANISYKPDVDLQQLAKKTENYSGAYHTKILIIALITLIRTRDLQALIYNSQLAAVHSRLDRLKSGDVNPENQEEQGMHHSFHSGL